MAWESWVRLVHVLGAMLWLGGGLFALLIVMPAVRAPGPAGKGFMLTVLRQGGYGRFFGPVGSITIIAGLVLFWAYGYHDSPFADLPSSLVSIGAIIGLLAWIEGLAVQMPGEMKLKKLAKEVGPQGPTPAQVAEFERLGMKQGKASARSVILISIAGLLMLLRFALL